MKKFISSLDWGDFVLWLWCVACGFLMVTAAIQEAKHPRPVRAEQDDGDDLMDAVLMQQLFFNPMNR